MARQKADPEQRIRAYGLWWKGNGPTQIFNSLCEEFNKVVSERTVATWIKEFKSLQPEIVDLDAGVQWNRFEEYGLPWESSSFLFGMLYFVVGLGPFPEGRLETIPTVRQLRWWWRIHLSLPALNKFNVFHIAQRFVARELLHEIAAEPLALGDLEAYLIFQPWLSEGRLRHYQSAIRKGAIPPLRNLTRLREDSQNIRELAPADRILRHVELVGYIDVDPDHPERLPNEQFTLEWLSNVDEYYDDLIESEGGK